MSADIRITPRIALGGDEVEFRFVRASGPGGQNVNKVATAAELRFNLSATKSLPDAVKEKLRKLAGNRISRDGVLCITAQRYRTQERNRADALARLTALIRRAAQPEKKRIPTKPTQASRRRRLEGKRQLSSKKQLRRASYD
ncbi:MAG TPA: alternative ribosome rescue aminoacyl-tRNA hydrolase ArfB [Gammaproteobacteria bacterium]|nr:alternative ribosome rescue aminoacyl-tRNA hydrolase ArfB [Gammaproteobacteria bacterium]